MNRTEYLLIQLASECNEVAHRVTKALHFGLDEKQAGQPFTNAQRIEQELTDLTAVVGLLQSNGVIEADHDVVAYEQKQDKVTRYMAYAREIGTLK